MRVYKRVVLVLAILGLFGGAVIMRFLWVTRAAREEYASCEREMQAMVPKLKEYADAHDGNLPCSEIALAKVLGKPLPSQYIFVAYHLPVKWRSTGLRRYIIDRNPHPFTIQGLMPWRRIHMLLTDGTVFRARTYNDDT